MWQITARSAGKDDKIYDVDLPDTAAPFQALRDVFAQHDDPNARLRAKWVDSI